MSLQPITASDIGGWNSLQDIANSFEKRGLKPRQNLGKANEFVLQIDDDEFVVLVKAGPGEAATDFKPENRSRHTNLVATKDFKNFTFLTRMRSWEGQQHGRIKHQKISFTKEQFTRDSGEKNTILQKLNAIEYGSSTAIYDTLYDTQQVVKEFYEDFEELRTDLVQEVTGIPDDRGDSKQRYVQVILDRMIFLYFIQEKRLLNREINYLHEKPEIVVDDGKDIYENFYRPLFFDYLADKNQHPDFGMLPYLNGGLFAKNPVEEEFPDAKLGASAAETNALFDDILDFLSDWNWNVDERLDIVDPKNLSPAILGHIFEQTVNQKEMGAYYTPEEITGFMSRRTIHPYLVDQLNDAVGAEYEAIDDVFGFAGAGAGGGTEVLADGGTITPQVPTENVQTKHVETLYHDILKEAHVLDPAVGSGAFLLAAQDVLVDIYMQCIEFFQQLEQEGKGWELESRTREELEEINKGQGGASLYAKRTVILNNLYGVDIDEGAVEICKLRLWLSMVADIEDEPNEVEPLPNIDFNIRQGNSLIGFTEVIEINDKGEAPLNNYGGGIGESVKDMYEEVIDAIERHRESRSSKLASEARREAEKKISSHIEVLDEKILDVFHKAGSESTTIEDVKEFSPFHWVIEFAPVYATGGFDVVIGNPPWDKLKAERDDYFPRFDEKFRFRPPAEKDAKEQELLENEAIAEGWEKYQERLEKQMRYFTDGSHYELLSPEVKGKQVAAENNLSAIFLERTFTLAKDGGYVAQVLPNVLFNGSSMKDLRLKMVNEGNVKSLVGFENKGIFEAIDDRFRFTVAVFCNGGYTERLPCIFEQHDPKILRDIDERLTHMPRDLLIKYSHESQIIPLISSEKQLAAIKKILEHPRIGDEVEDSWFASLYMKELDRSTDSDRFVENREEGDYPIYEGKNMHQFTYNNIIDILSPISLWGVDEDDPEKSAKHRVRMKNFRSHNPEISLKKAIYEGFDGSGSQKGFVNSLLKENGRQELSEEDILLDCTEYRIAIRRIANATNERSIIASVIPKDAVTVNSLCTIRPYKIDVSEDDLNNYPMHSAYEKVFTAKELFVLVGILNSIPFDYLMRTKIDTNILQHKLEESQLPRLTEGDNWFHYISDRAARLNCYGEKFEEMRERLGGVDTVTEVERRHRLQAEIDAAALHAYGLNRSEAEYLLDDFHRMEDPQVMTEDYFDSVLKKYDSLSDGDPRS